MSKKNTRDVRFTLTDEDYKAFGRYRIMYTEQGRKLVGRQRATFIVSGAGVALLFTLFHVSQRSFTYLAYGVAAVLILTGIFFAEKLVIRQQDKAIDADSNSAERIHAVENRIVFGEDGFVTYAGDDEQSFEYTDIRLADLAETAVYVWMSDTMIMPLPLHAFGSMSEMKELYRWLKSKTDMTDARKH